LAPKQLFPPHTTIPTTHNFAHIFPYRGVIPLFPTTNYPTEELWVVVGYLGGENKVGCS